MVDKMDEPRPDTQETRIDSSERTDKKERKDEIWRMVGRERR